MTKKKAKGPWGVFLSILLAMAFGSWAGKETLLFGVSYYAIFDVLGTMFLNALTLVVVPLVSSSIISGLARMGSEERMGRIGLKMFTFYIGTSLTAVLIGLAMSNLFHPGSASLLSADMQKSTVTYAGYEASQTLVKVLLSIIPSNIVNAFAKGEMLGLIFFSLLFGYALSKVRTEAASTLSHFFQGLFQIMLEVTHLVMKVLPYGVFVLVAKVFMTTGIHSLGPLALFTTTVLSGLILFMCVALPLYLKFIARVNPLTHFKAMAPALVTAFSTSSSAATLPITMDCVEKRANVSNRITSLVLPLGTSINMSGSALYECVAAMFIAQAYGLDLSFSTQVLVVFLALISSIGVAGVPSASLVAVLIMLKVLGLPAEGVGLIIAVDRVLDMCRTTVNVFSDSCCAILVARAEGETGVLATDQFEE